MTTEHRARLLQRFYLFTPLVAAVAGVAFAMSPLADFVPKHMPTSVGGYTNQAMNLAPFGWFVLALGCSVGTCQDLAKRNGATGWRLAAWICCVTPFIFTMQVVICGGIAVGGCALLEGTKGF